MLRKVLRFQALIRKRDSFTILLDNRSLQQLALRLERRVHVQSVVPIDREQVTVERNVMRLTQREHVRQIRLPSRYSLTPGVWNFFFVFNNYDTIRLRIGDIVTGSQLVQ